MPDRLTKTEMRRVWRDANAAGREAATACRPTPMVVQQRANPLDDSSPVIRQYAPVEGGVCGFAYVTLKGNTRFGRFLKAEGIARPNYPTGLYVSISDYGQSLERKEAHANAAAKFLRDAGILDAHSESRMD